MVEGNGGCTHENDSGDGDVLSRQEAAAVDGERAAHYGVADMLFLL
jgi:hypothetical protein